MSKLSLAAAGASALAVGLAACGGSSSTSSSASSTSSSAAASSTSSSATPASSASAGGGAAGGLSIAADPSGKLAFTKKTLSAKAGTVEIDFTNKAPLSHNLTIQKGTSGATVGATPTLDGGSKTLTVKLAPGTYTFFCSVPGHRMAGMQGTLTVK
ncbi:MAG: plastocyanin/azurin family copper-binding protein [Solirubrobacteraceae bacterium]